MVRIPAAMALVKDGRALHLTVEETLKKRCVISGHYRFTIQETKHTQTLEAKCDECREEKGIKLCEVDDTHVSLSLIWWVKKKRAHFRAENLRGATEIIGERAFQTDNSVNE